jgi:hypothetical protein
MPSGVGWDLVLAIALVIENCLPFFFETQICPGPIATNVYVCDVAGLEGK